MAFAKEGINQITFSELVEILNDPGNKKHVIDVRELEEYVEGHIPGIPLIPMSEIVDLVDQFDRNEDYVLVCRSGRRSHEVAKFFKMNGIEKVANYADGMLGWQHAQETGETHVISNVSDLFQKKQ